jgi:(R,R)-butanediol dehydrogenase / meso-butanediol dehydrogenase / diacetyl reductase
MGELALVKEYNCIRMPDYISDQEGALIEPAAVAVHAMDRSGITPGGSVLITGGGPIGALAVLAARAAGAARIVLSEPNPNRRRKVAEIAPGIISLDPTEPGFLEQVRALTEEGVGVAAAIECAGNPRALQSCIDAVRPQGTVVLVGLMGVPAEISTFDLTMRDITLRGSLNYPLNVWPRIFEMIHSDIYPVGQVVDAEIALEGVVERGFAPLLDKAGTSMKILINMQE